MSEGELESGKADKSCVASTIGRDEPNWSSATTSKATERRAILIVFDMRRRYRVTGESLESCRDEERNPDFQQKSRKTGLLSLFYPRIGGGRAGRRC